MSDLVRGGRGGAWPNRGVRSQDQAISHVEILQRTTTCGQLLSWRWKTKTRQAANREITAFYFIGITEELLETGAKKSVPLNPLFIFYLP